MEIDQDKMFTTEEIASMLKVKSATVRRWIREGDLAAYRIGQNWRVSGAQIFEFLEKRSSTGKRN